MWVHFHDIYLPYDYTHDTLDGDMPFPQESTLLYAFLAGNVDGLRPGEGGHFPSACWLRMV